MSMVDLNEVVGNLVGERLVVDHADPAINGEWVRCLTWTREPPRRAGWYWTLTFGVVGSLRPVEIRTSADLIAIRNFDSPHTRWAGPIPEPMEPVQP